MIPVRLSIKGLYSYREKQEIDFHPLIASQLFGIFGAVGSGKSSILEAMMFLLFDQSDRLTAKDNRYYNMLNLQSNEMEIDFVFRAGVHSKEQYRFYFSAKRKKNEFEKVEVKDRTYYRWQNDAWTPLSEGENAASILGMSYQNFMQTIIIPQGKFREFIDLTPTHRTRMLKELFHLERFDLTYNTNVLMNKCRSKIDKLEGELKGIGEVGQEEMKTLEQEIAQGEKKLKENEGKLKEVEKEHQELDQLKTLFQKLEALQEQLQYLQDQHTVFAAREKRLVYYERAYKFFKEKFTTQQEALQQIKQKKALIEQYTRDILKKEGELKEAQKAQQAAKIAYDNRDEIRRKCDELRILIELKDLHLKGQGSAQKAAKEEEQLQLFRKQKEENTKIRDEKDRQIEALEKKLTDTKTLYDLAHWLHRKEELLQEKEKISKERKQHQEEKLKVKQACKKLYVEYAWLSEELSFKEIYQKIRHETAQLTQTEEKLMAELRELHVKQELVNYASALQEGVPCPLCGATHHPHVIHPDTALQALEAKEKEVQKVRNERRKLEELEKAIGNQENELKLIDTLLEKAELAWKQINDKLAQHQQTFVWKTYAEKTAAEVSTLIKNAEQQQSSLEKLKNESRTLKSNIEKQEKALEQIQKQHEEARKIAHEVEVTIHTKRNSIKILNADNLVKLPTEKLSSSLAKGEKEYKEIEQAYEQKREAVEKLMLDLKGLKTQKEADAIHWEDLVKKAQQLDQEIRHLCTEHAFAGPEEVKQLLQQKLNTDAERNKIDEYKEQLHGMRGSYQQLRKEAENKSYNEHYHRELVFQCNTLKEEVDVQKENLTLQRKQLADLAEKLEKRAKLGKALDQLTSRQENLKELSGLFRGSGFVNYASHIYLSDLCKAANERFMKLTKNNLSLELNENNDFIVRDYLNDGKTRLLKTLSGGQTFQAALCLALALAENVKSLYQAEQSFFFLDEGFGALDKESLSIVFDTLKSLQKENRIVGVISHVEELQQEIDIFLKIENDRERGSLIHYSWQ